MLRCRTPVLGSQGAVSRPSALAPGAHGEHPVYGPPRAAGVMGCGEGIFSPPAAPACLGYQMQAGRGRRGAGAENELKVK